MNSIFIEYTPSFKTPESLVDFVDEMLDKKCNYFIAGGSLCDIYLGNKQINDIDIFFENLNDLDEFQRSIKLINTDILFTTDNAITFVYKHTTIQLIKIITGTPTRVMSKFDINKSRRCITSNKEHIIDESFYDRLHVDYKNFKSHTPNRYIKYVHKGFMKSQDEIDNILYTVENLPMVNAYNGEVDESIQMWIRLLYYAFCLNDNDEKKCIIAIIERVKLLNPSSQNWQTFFEPFYDKLNMEYIFDYDVAIQSFFDIGKQRHTKITSILKHFGSRKEEIKSKYPEELI